MRLRGERWLTPSLLQCPSRVAFYPAGCLHCICTLSTRVFTHEDSPGTGTKPPTQEPAGRTAEVALANLWPLRMPPLYLYPLDSPSTPDLSTVLVRSTRFLLSTCTCTLDSPSASHSALEDPIGPVRSQLFKDLLDGRHRSDVALANRCSLRIYPLYLYPRLRLASTLHLYLYDRLDSPFTLEGPTVPGTKPPTQGPA